MEERSRATVVVWIVAAGLAAFALMRLVGCGGSEPPPVQIAGGGPGAGVAASGSGGSAAAGSAAGAGLYVHVAGAVRRPGLIRVADGARLATALERAGGPTRRADLTMVNLAARVQDGQQIVVPVVGRGAAATTGVSGGASALPGAKLHLSSATPEELDEVDGIGPTLAERIVQYRDAHGGFRSLDELSEVEGIGEKRLATLRDALQP